MSTLDRIVTILVTATLGISTISDHHSSKESSGRCSLSFVWLGKNAPKAT